MSQDQNLCPCYCCVGEFVKRSSLLTKQNQMFVLDCLFTGLSSYSGQS